ncbi:MAG: hypothetical protein OXH69_11800 [Acidobacteria bacterium]|nr:hypothetical protein [Acidobacteriota bacterium]
MLAGLATEAAAQSATVSVTAGADVTEGSGTGSTFVISVSPTQSSAVPFKACLTSSESSLSGITVTRGANQLTLTSGCLTASVPTNSSFDITISGLQNAADEPDEVVTATISADPNNALPAGVVISSTANTDTITIRDAQPTVVRLARVGTATAINEGQTVEFTVTLGRALIAGETIDVPLSISGPGVTIADWILDKKSGTNLNTGVSLHGTSTTGLAVRFSGAGARVATLNLEAAADNVAEGSGSETFTVALGANSAFDHSSRRTNVGGGADPSGTASERSFSVQVNDATVTAAVPVVRVEVPTVTEGETIAVRLTLSRASTETVRVFVNGATFITCDLCPTGTTKASGSDFTNTHTVVSFAPGVTTKTVSFPTNDDSTVESTEVFGVILADPAGALGLGTKFTVDPATPPDGVNRSYPYWFARIEDNDAKGTFSTGSLRIVETGNGTYTVALTTQPAAAVSVTIMRSGTNAAAATTTPTFLVFNPTGANLWSTPQTVTVRGADESGTHRNRSLTLAHNAASTDANYNNRNLGTVSVEVADAPVVETYDPWGSYFVRSGRENEPSPAIVTSVKPMSYKYKLRRDLWLGAVVSGEGRLDYSVRASNAPVGGPITVTAMVLDAHNDRNEVGLSLTPTGAPQNSVTFTLSNRVPQNLDCDADRSDGNTDVSWGCSMGVYVVRKLASNQRACANIQHTVTGGGVRASDTDYHVIRVQLSAKGDSDFYPCQKLNWEGWPWLTPQFAASRDSGKPVNSEESGGAGAGLPVTLPNAATPAPEGGTAGIAIDLGRALKKGERAELELAFSGATPGTDYTLALVAGKSKGVTVKTGAPLTGAKPVLVFAEGARTAELTLTVLDDQVYEAEMLTVAFGKLRHIVDGLEDRVTTPEGSVRYALLDSTGQPLTITRLADASVAENKPWSAEPLLEGVTGSVAFSLTGADAARFTLDTKTGSLALPAQDFEAPADANKDNVYEATLTATDPGGTDSVAFRVTVIDVAEGGTAEADPAVVAMVEAMIVRHRDVTGNKGALANWEKALKTLKGQPGGFTIAELEARVAGLSGTPKKRWQRVLDAVKAMQSGGGTPAAPAITVTAGAAVTEGTAASFTLAAESAPKADLAVTVTVGQTGAYVASRNRGARAVTILAGAASADFTVATKGDEKDEPDGAVTATVEAGAGYAAGGSALASVPVRDDDATGMTLSAEAGDIAEDSGHKLLRLTLGRALVEGEILAVPLVLSGTATLGVDYTLGLKGSRKGVSHANLASADPAKPPTVTFAGPSAKVATLVLEATADSTQEGESETVTVALGALSATGLGGGAEGSGTVAFAILEPPPEVSIAAKTVSVTEGADAAFTVTASRAPGSDLTVNLTVSEATGSDMVAADNEGAATVTIPKGKTEAAFTVPTVNDSQDEPDGTVTATLAADGSEGARYTVAAAPKDAATVKVADDDAAIVGPALSVDDVTVDERERLMWFTVKLSPAAAGPVSVSYRTRESTPVSARQGQDYLGTQWHLSFTPGETEKRFWVYVFDDSHDEDPETFEVALSNARGAAIANGVAVGTIVNDDPMPAAWLARFGRTAAEQALDGIAGRMAAPRTAGMQGTIAGQALSFTPGSEVGAGAPNGPATDSPFADRQAALADVARRFGGNANGHGADGFGPTGFSDTPSHAQHRTMTAREALLGSSFTLTGTKDGSGVSLAFWGRAAQSSFDGREGTFSLDGETTTAMLGADYARGKWLVGLALMQSEGEGGYADRGTGPQRCPDADDGADPDMRAALCNGAVREGDGKVEASLTAAMPYAALQASERLKLWGAAGSGSGEVTLKPAVGGSLKSDISWTMAAAGLRSELLTPPAEGGGPALALTTDALWARTSSEKTDDLAASDSNVTRLRLGLEGSWRIATEGGGHVVPKLTLGARHDGGDAETGFGVELGGGVAWVDPGLGLSLDVEGRTLLAHGSDDLEDRGFAVSMTYDPDPVTQQGPSLTLRQDWGGQATGGLDALFAADPLEKRSGGGEAESRWQAEAAYGFPAFGGRFTGSLHVGLGLATGTRDYSLGWRLTPVDNASDLSFGVKTTRRESDTAEPEHAVGFDVTARW